MAATTSNVYIHVIEDVITNVRDNFINLSGPGEDVLKEFQALWELKMMQCGAICGPIERSSIPRPVAGVSGTPVHDLNVPYEGTEEYETPTAEILFPPTPLQTPIQTPLPGPVEHSTYPLPTGNNDFPSVPGSGVTADVKPGRPSPYMQPPSPWMNQRPLGVDVNIAYVEGRDEVERVMSHHPMTQDFFMSSSGKRKRDDFAPHFHNGYLPQQDGAGDAMPEFFQMEISEGSNSRNRHDRITANREMLPAHVTMPSSGIPQQDGPIPDAYDNLYPYQGVASEDYNTVNTPAIQEFQARTPVVGIQSDIGDEDEPLNENDDDDDFDDVDQEEELNTHHLVLAQFDKVTRTKSRWKCTLKDGIMHINNKDVLFTKAIGEFDF